MIYHHLQSADEINKFHDGHSCSPCTVWIQTGSDDILKKYHITSNGAHHPGDKATEFSEYLSMNGLYSITLREDICLCSACYIDCTRKAGKPRWYQYSKNSVLKHCTLCCDPSATCKCEEIVDWGPQNWFDSENIEHWWMYFTIN